ncbi:hypothetical protein FA95DRAFT_653534 [Auriscalpium vulgare]|uniref:Uncharacterized protein n=1 Tax=Auriscalpium vulgare TaxID=40419 RepID=A0ACB8RC74_9AGAM|nr:hypothetical protein FA95DRAFT_653534 [Auriscalpium vulgare]
MLFHAPSATFPVHPTYIFVNGKSSLVNRVIDIWPSIRILDVATVDKGIPINVPSAIQALSSDASGHRWNYSSAHVPAPPVQALHDLELYPDRMSRAPLAESSVLAQVHTLRLPGVSAVDLPTAVLTGLQSLVIGWLPIVETFSLPRSLRHLGYHPEYHPFEKDEQVQILLAAVRARTELELFTATRYSSPAVLKQFESVCGELGVEFLVYPEPACFPHPRNVDWI